jgi:hypothetical protein
MKSMLWLATLAALALGGLIVSAPGQDKPDTATLPPIPDNNFSPFQQLGNQYWPGYGGTHLGRNSASSKFMAEEMRATQETTELVRKLAEAKGDEKDKVRSKLNDSLEKQFDLRQKRHNSEIEALEEQIKKLKDLVQKRQDSRKEIISRRLDQLVREAQGLGW